MQVVRFGGKCIGIVLFRDDQLATIRKRSRGGENTRKRSRGGEMQGRSQETIELVNFLARPRDGVLVHYMFCERMKVRGVQVRCCCNCATSLHTGVRSLSGAWCPCAHWRAFPERRMVPERGARSLSRERVPFFRRGLLFLLSMGAGSSTHDSSSHGDGA